MSDKPDTAASQVPEPESVPQTPAVAAQSSAPDSVSSTFPTMPAPGFEPPTGAPVEPQIATSSVPPVPELPVQQGGVAAKLSWLGSRKRVATGAVAVLMSAALFGGGFAAGANFAHHGPSDFHDAWKSSNIADNRDSELQESQENFPQPGPRGPRLRGNQDSATPSDTRGADGRDEMEEGRLSSGGDAATPSES